jgi:HAD superfamily hydrolase (TIGR01509 family)
MLHGIIWDMDGVLVDTGEEHYISWAEALATTGIPFSRELFRAVFGMNNKGSIEYLTGTEQDPAFVASISEKKEIIFRNLVRGRARPLPGALHWLEQFRRLGCQQAIASSAPHTNIDALIDELKIRPYFQAIISGFDLPAKPDPLVFLRAAAQLGLEPGSCVVIEDSIAGVQGARRAGMKCIAVTTTNPSERLSGADLVLNSLEELDEGALKSILP